MENSPRRRSNVGVRLKATVLLLRKNSPFYTVVTDTGNMELSKDSTDYKSLLKTVAGEALDEVKNEQVAIAWMIMNRVKDPRWPNTIAEVCRQPDQFPWWDDEKQLEQLLSENDDKVKQLDSWLHRVYVDCPDDPTDGANHCYVFCGPQAARPPKWANVEARTAIIGHHKFYQL